MSGKQPTVQHCEGLDQSQRVFLQWTHMVSLDGCKHSGFGNDYSCTESTVRAQESLVNKRKCLALVSHQCVLVFGRTLVQSVLEVQVGQCLLWERCHTSPQTFACL
ncbi:hypothetical protein INR49_018341 [Caranx melampygus]|nr:hypothetical protein INR49_018341 [Caranx melampygus]